MRRWEVEAGSLGVQGQPRLCETVTQKAKQNNNLVLFVIFFSLFSVCYFLRSHTRGQWYISVTHAGAGYCAQLQVRDVHLQKDFHPQIMKWSGRVSLIFISPLLDTCRWEPDITSSFPLTWHSYLKNLSVRKTRFPATL